jgi:signal transduction histidine kinase
MDVQYDFARDPADPSGQGREQLERLAGCFQKALGHDLPNQLVALQGLARMLEQEQGGRLDADGRACLLRLAELAGRADGLARRLAEVGRLSRDPGPPESVALAEAAREAAAEVNLLSSGPAVEYHFQDDAPTLPVSRRSLRAVLVELLRNAARAAAAERPLWVEIGGRRTPDGVEWWVRDDGRGLPEARQATLFDGLAAGGGLGLFLVRQVAAAWGGAVRVQSQPGAGTAVTLFVRDP